MLGPFIFKELTPSSLVVTCSVTGKHYASLLVNNIPVSASTTLPTTEQFSCRMELLHTLSLALKMCIGDIVQKIMSPVAIFVMSGLQDPQALNSVIFGSGVLKIVGWSYEYKNFAITQ